MSSKYDTARYAHWAETPAEKFRRRCAEKEEELIKLGMEENA